MVPGVHQSDGYPADAIRLMMNLLLMLPPLAGSSAGPPRHTSATALELGRLGQHEWAVKNWGLADGLRRLRQSITQSEQEQKDQEDQCAFSFNLPEDQGRSVDRLLYLVGPRRPLFGAGP